MHRGKKTINYVRTIKDIMSDSKVQALGPTLGTAADQSHPES